MFYSTNHIYKMRRTRFSQLFYFYKDLLYKDEYGINNWLAKIQGNEWA